MIIPWQVDVPQERLPLANWLIIGVIIGFFVWQLNQINTYHTTIAREIVDNTAKQNQDLTIKTDLFNGLVLNGWKARELLGHMWLHGGWMHLVGNLLFLWIFGNAVCAKIGQIPFIIVYLIFGVAAGAAHLFFTGGPAIGASGAINGVVGMYLVLFPTNTITGFYLMVFPFLYWKPFEIPSYILILIWLAYDIFGAATGGGHIAYFAHLGGFAAGIVLVIVLLQIKFIRMTRYEKSIFQIFSELRAKPQPKEPYFQKVLMGSYLDTEVNQIAEKSSADTTSQIGQYVLDGSSINAGTSVSDGYIRFYCSCGKRCKVAVQFAGKTGKCPQCKKLISIPSL
ncbi:MAG: rhomboid family intramembrane serine protease [Phycisphaerae bacterium]|nr:rhomboid family intramembrane serine protease [Phycisphaerae bacterium]